MMEKKPKITVKDLWKGYDTLQVLKGLNLEVMEGETVVILGRSGVGKSVLLKQIIGIEKPDKGEIHINGQNLSLLSPKEKTHLYMDMGMLFQGSALFDSMTVGKNIAFYLNQHGDRKTGLTIAQEEILKRATEALHMVNLYDIEDKMPSELSGGMRKRAALARLIVYRPAILLYDEPTTGLDPVTAMQINELIVKIQKELKATSIVVTHDLRSAMEVGDRIAFHYDGKIRHIANKKDFFDIDDEYIQAFIKNATVTKEGFHNH